MKKQKPGMRKSFRVVALTAVLCFALGITAAFFFLETRFLPEWAAESATDQTVTVSQEPFADEIVAPATVVEATQREIRSNTSGIIRQTFCTVGVPLTSGQSPFMINDTKILAIATETPTWRDMEPGITGTDVAELQEELSRLGYYTGEADGRYGFQTGVAVAALWAEVGGKSNQNTIPLQQIIWIPDTQVRPTDCTFAVGDLVNTGDTLFTLGGGIAQLTAQISETSYPGERLAFVGETITPLNEDGTITDPEFLSAFAQTQRYQQYLQDPSRQLGVDIRLAEPTQVSIIPASALYQIVSPQACVYTGREAVRVTIVASRFGNTLVIPDSSINQVMVTAPEDAAPCG